MTELKACPFCGGKAEVDVSEVTLNGDACCDELNASCIHCDRPRGSFTDYLECVKDWNTRAQSEWVSVDDRLPEDNCGYKFLVSITNDQVDDLVSSSIYFSGGFKQVHRSGISHGFEVQVGVTHWMPMPLSPNE